MAVSHNLQVSCPAPALLLQKLGHLFHRIFHKLDGVDYVQASLPFVLDVSCKLGYALLCIISFTSEYASCLHGKQHRPTSFPPCPVGPLAWSFPDPFLFCDFFLFLFWDHFFYYISLKIIFPQQLLIPCSVDHRRKSR